MNIREIVQRQRTYFKSGATRSVEFRIHQLKTLKKMLSEHEEEFIEALYKDFRKPRFETYETELGVLQYELTHTIKNLKRWAKPERVSGALVNFPSSNYIYSEPYGNVLIISPWNYPAYLALLPVIGAIAAGNTVILKPSEVSSETSAVMNKTLSKWFKEEFIAVVEGDHDVNQELLDQNFDHILFTGSTRVGKIVMQKAAQNLTPVTLELGGKSPCIVHESTDLKIGARRIAWGKFLNAGQTCVAPDYVMVHESIHKPFVQEIKKCIREFYGVNPKLSPDFPRMINEEHFDRLLDFLKEGHIECGGKTDREDLYIEPTVLTGISPGDAIMQEEIFGPILPVLSFKDLEEVLEVVRSKEKPLAFYIFSKEQSFSEALIEACSFGGGAVNDVVAHLGNPRLPFGGVGNSGMGAYHGKHSFETFSHKKSIMKKSFWLDIPIRYAPYKGKLKWVKKILK